MTYVAWSRTPPGVWKKIATAPTERECWLILLALPKADKIEKYVNTGKHPDARKRPR